MPSPVLFGIEIGRRCQDSATLNDLPLGTLPLMAKYSATRLLPKQNWRVFLPISRRTVTTGWVGAMLYRGRSSISSHASKRSAKYCFECVNRYLLHTSLLSQIPKRSHSPAPHTTIPLTKPESLTWEADPVPSAP